MVNPFEQNEGGYLVLMNGEGQYSLWPDFQHVPAGWEVVHQTDSREACMDYISTHWTDMRPDSLRPKADAVRR
ncbi:MULTISPECIES: MbtH family protein [Paenibacillus]|uniref:MbtH family protein n=1 Tax=Paenibacillus kribbensis TaxID=172713 RepID=A0A222WRZ8_9BACL|nr:MULTISPECIES: MbtH family NRPS accessory protein [Paenibacillus]ASR48463.1 MbtH family protein [Paenibacillus kribbensis]EHS58228.1 hypothetical protein WG8_1488 [Paenibacillus sp. Aloe-11]MEC0233363.1 MbtH family NRPS accessory protein [Paenibacillus kribbensis]